MIPNQGRNEASGYMVSDASSMEWGDGTTSESLSDTALENELLSKGESDDDVTFSDGGDGEAVFEGLVALDELNGEDVSEVGITGASAFWLRIVHEAVAKENDFELEYEITVTYSNG